MVTLKEVYQINERADFQYIATDLISKYKLRSKVKFKSGRGKADYDWMTDTINLRPSYSNIKDFIITVLHEIKHALDAKKIAAPIRSSAPPQRLIIIWLIRS